MTPTCAELMETAELSDSLREASLPFDGVLDTVEGHLQQTTGSSVKERLRQTTGSSAGRQLQPTTNSSEIVTAVVPVECTSTRAVVYPNSKSVDLTIIIGNNKRFFPVMESDTAEELGDNEQGLHSTTVATDVAGAEQQTRTGHRCNQISSSHKEPTFTEFEETSRGECSHFGEAVIPRVTVEPGLATKTHTCEGGGMPLEGWMTTAHDVQRLGRSEESSARQTSFTKLTAEEDVESEESGARRKADTSIGDRDEVSCLRRLNSPALSRPPKPSTEFRRTATLKALRRLVMKLK